MPETIVFASGEVGVRRPGGQWLDKAYKQKTLTRWKLAFVCPVDTENVLPKGFEPLSSVPETEILSIELRKQ